MEKGTAKRGHSHDENEDQDNIHGDDDDTRKTTYIFFNYFEPVAWTRLYTNNITEILVP